MHRNQLWSPETDLLQISIHLGLRLYRWLFWPKFAILLLAALGYEGSLIMIMLLFYSKTHKAVTPSCSSLTSLETSWFPSPQWAYHVKAAWHLAGLGLTLTNFILCSDSFLPPSSILCKSVKLTATFDIKEQKIPVTNNLDYQCLQK